MDVLVSGASIAGPVLAYWLTRYGYRVTVVERAPSLRKTGGHAVDLFRPAMEISARMGVLPRIEASATGMTRMTAYRQGVAKPVTVDLTKVIGAASDQHAEIMRDDLSEIYYDATVDDVEYVFDDSVTSVSPAGEVTFERGEPRRFDLVVGADGLHSNVRRLVFGPEEEFSRFIGVYLGVLSLPDEVSAPGEYVVHMGVNRMAGIYRARHTPDARAVLLFRPGRQLDYHHRDVPRQQQLLREHFGGMHEDVDRWLGELDRTPAFYFDSVTQLHMDSWSRDRVTLVGDAGYCPGPAVGGSTTLAVYGAYVLAGELAAAGGDHAAAFRAYEDEMADVVRRSRSFATGAARTLVPSSPFGVWALLRGARLVSLLPAAVGRGIANLNTKSIRLHDSMVVRDYPRNSVATT